MISQNYGYFIDILNHFLNTYLIRFHDFEKYFLKLSMYFLKYTLIFKYFKRNNLYLSVWSALKDCYYVICYAYHLQYGYRGTFKHFVTLWPIKKNRLRSLWCHAVTKLRNWYQFLKCINTFFLFKYGLKCTYHSLTKSNKTVWVYNSLI